MSAAITAIELSSPLPSANGIAFETNNVSGVDFLGQLKAGAVQLNEQADQATALLSSYAVGENVAPHDLVMAMEQAKLSLQLAVEVRNRLVDAYQELARLQI
ncbi:flagellar hook-basal body complex protein FliE [Pseudomonas palleroniana]|uniref:Flagellar hook-basal body complex protein FliE n=1 Tax=Pseudomonas palleroniana TaxID=191390 RepID=A0A125PJW2_9PSED|nr:flagellar hook-basal body complex protein FliE [Pseudomonas palleroniana]KWU52859.1 flagellar hook-basal body protein FliE [Pseudomonas palleroniana]